jgi:hypothetical protein
MGQPQLIVELESAPLEVCSSGSNDMRWILTSPTTILKKLSGHVWRFDQSQPRKFRLDINLERPVEML